MTTPHTEHWRETLDQIDVEAYRNHRADYAYTVRCPDGVERRIWGVDRAIGAVFISGWDHDAWMDCSSGHLRVEFD